MIDEKVLATIVESLKQAGCESALIGSIWEHFDKGTASGVLKAVSYAWEMTR